MNTPSHEKLNVKNINYASQKQAKTVSAKPGLPDSTTMSFVIENQGNYNTSNTNNKPGNVSD
jgi:hypothetical protein